MNILLIIADYAPIGGSHSIRMSRLVDGLRRGGHNLTVLTTGTPELHPQYDPENFKVSDEVFEVRVPMGTIHKAIYISKSKNSSVSSKSTNRTNKFSLKLLCKRLYRRFSIPDTLVDWYYAFKKQLPNLKKELQGKFDLIISCSMPNTAHLIGYKLSHVLNVPLAMDIADPWAYISGYEKRPVWHALQKYIEKRIVNHAEFISFSTEGARCLYGEKYGMDSKRMISIVTGYSQEQKNQCIEFSKKIKKEPSQKLNMIYGGAVLPGVRDPEPLLKAISFELTNSGKNDLCFELYVDDIQYTANLVDTVISNCVSVTGYIPYDELMLRLMSSDVLVLFGNSTTDQLPGKLFEYMATGKHILYLLNCDAEKDQVLPILKVYQNYTCASNNCNDVREALQDLLDKKRRSKLNDIYCEGTEEFLSSNLFAKLSDYIGEWNNEQAKKRT